MAFINWAGFQSDIFPDQYSGSSAVCEEKSNEYLVGTRIYHSMCKMKTFVEFSNKQRWHLLSKSLLLIVLASSFWVLSMISIWQQRSSVDRPNFETRNRELLCWNWMWKMVENAHRLRSVAKILSTVDTAKKPDAMRKGMSKLPVKSKIAPANGVPTNAAAPRNNIKRPNALVNLSSPRRSTRIIDVSAMYPAGEQLQYYWYFHLEMCVLFGSLKNCLTTSNPEQYGHYHV